MVYEVDCKLNREQTVEFYRGDEPQVYCRGYIDKHTNEPIEKCEKCLNFYLGEQREKDFNDSVEGE